MLEVRKLKMLIFGGPEDVRQSSGRVLEDVFRSFLVALRVLDVLSGFGMVLGGFKKDLGCSWRISGGSRGAGTSRGRRFSGP